MAEATFFALGQNAAMLLAVALVYDVAVAPQRTPLAQVRQVVVGVLIGVIGLVIMVTPFEYVPGIVFDTRSVLLGVAGLFFGAIPTAAATALTAAARLSQGGAGAWTGVAVIVASGCIGVAWRRLRGRGLEDLSLGESYLFGLVVHVVMLALMFTLPWAVAAEVIGAIGLPVISIYPLATVVLAALMVNRLRRERVQRTLRDSEERLRLAVAAGDLGLWDLNMQTGESTVNAQYARMLGYDPADFHESIAAATERTHPDDREARAAAYGDYLAGKLPQYQAEFRKRTRSGDWKWILTQGQFVERDAQGSPLRMLGIHLDISARRQAEDELRAAADDSARLLEAEVRSRRALLSIVEDEKAAERVLSENETRYRSLVMHSPYAIFVNRDDRVALVNDACLRLFGAQREEELLGKPVMELYHPDDHARIRERIHRLRDFGEAVEPLGERIIRLDGRVVDVEVAASPFDDRGTRAAHVVLSDITERKRAEEALRESRDRLEAILASLVDAVILVDPAAHLIIECNDAATSMFGYSREDLVGMDTRVLHVDQRHFKRFRQQNLAAYEDPGYYAGEFEMRRKDGGVFPTENLVRPLRDPDGRILYVVSVVRDITERKRAEAEIRQLNEGLEQRVVERTAELEAANKELLSFSYSVSHDLRAPLRAIGGFASMLARRYRDGLDETGRHYVDTIVSSSEHMGVLIEDLLTYARIGGRSVRAEPVPLGPFVEQLRATFGDRMAASGGTLEVVEPLATPLGDPALIERILVNLVDNALTYRRPDVAPQVTLSAARHGRKVTLAVADNGIGVAPEYRERIFEVFARLHTDEEYPGTGIGLSIVRKAARIMGGDVTMESTEGAGSTFSLELPAATKRSTPS